MMNTYRDSVNILLVEDDPADIDLIKEALEDSKLQVNLHVVRDGVEAIAYLRREGEYDCAIAPDLILLDLNLPRKNGQEVLKEIKTDDELKLIPVVIMTNSDSDIDILKSYSLGANCYVRKPLGLDEFIQIMRGIENFWFGIVKLPHRRNI